MQDQFLTSEYALLGREAIIFSSGRSGSNRILDIADRSGETHCRNEPNEYCVSFATLRDLPANEIRKHSDALISSMIAATRRYGDRDRFIGQPKKFLKPLLGEIFRCACRHRVLRENILGINTTEWGIPNSLFSDTWKESMVPVFKISNSIQTAKHVASAPASVKVIHNLRKPSAMMQSWWNRYRLEIRGGDLDFLELEINNELHKFDEGKRFLHENKDYAQLERIVRANLFAWRVSNEWVYDARKGKKNYMLVEYDDVSRHPSQKYEEILCFLNVNRDVKTNNRTLAENKLFRSKHQGYLSADLLSKAINEVIGDSPLRNLTHE